MIVTPIHNRIDPNRARDHIVVDRAAHEEKLRIEGDNCSGSDCNRLPLFTGFLVSFFRSEDCQANSIRDPHHQRADEDVDPARNVNHQHHAGIRPLFIGAVQVAVLVVVVDFPVAITVIGIRRGFVERGPIGRDEAGREGSDHVVQRRMMRLNARLIGTLFGQRVKFLKVANVAKLVQFVGGFVDGIDHAETKGQREIADEDQREQCVRTQRRD